jgi:hypothetical protein
MGVSRGGKGESEKGAGNALGESEKGRGRMRVGVSAEMHKPVPAGKRKLESGHFSQLQLHLAREPRTPVVEEIEFSFAWNGLIGRNGIAPTHAQEVAVLRIGEGKQRGERDECTVRDSVGRAKSEGRG